MWQQPADGRTARSQPEVRTHVNVKLLKASPDSAPISTAGAASAPAISGNVGGAFCSETRRQIHLHRLPFDALRFCFVNDP